MENFEQYLEKTIPEKDSLKLVFSLVFALMGKG